MLEAFHRAALQEKDRIYTYAYYLLGDRDEAEDVTQEVLLRLWKHFAELDGGNVAAWVTTVTRNAAHDVLRRRMRARERLAEDEEQVVRAVDCTEPGPERRADGAEIRRRLRTALLSLPESYRSVVVLREIQELSYREICETLGLPLASVKTRLHRGRKMLRERLRGVYEHVET